MGVCQDVFETSKSIHSLTVDDCNYSDFSAFLSCFFCISISFHVLFLLVLCFQNYKCMPSRHLKHKKRRLKYVQAMFQMLMVGMIYECVDNVFDISLKT